MFLLVLATMMIPFPVLMAPLYVLFKHLGWIGSFKPLWVPAWFGGAFSIFLLRQFYLTIPRAIDEAAMLDGCSRFGVFRRMILPLSRPALVVVALFQFIASWNDFVGPLLFLNHQEMLLNLRAQLAHREFFKHILCLPSQYLVAEPQSACRRSQPGMSSAPARLALSSGFTSSGRSLQTVRKWAPGDPFWTRT